MKFENAEQGSKRRHDSARGVLRHACLFDSPFATEYLFAYQLQLRRKDYFKRPTRPGRGGSSEAGQSLTGQRSLEGEAHTKAAIRPPARRGTMTSNGTMSNYRFLKEENISCGDWLSLARITYLDQNGQPRVWEGATRLTRNENTKIDAVGVIAFFKRLLHYDCIVLVKQYRPALKSYTIEMPSGLINDDETPDESALRELKECTGFQGSVKKIGPILAMDPGASNCCMRLVTIEINGDDPENLQMKTCASGDRFKEPILVQVSELLEQLSAFANAGFIIDSRIDAFAIGLVMGNNNRKNKIPTTLL